MRELNLGEEDSEDSYEITNDLKVCKEQMLAFLSIIKNQRDVLRESVKLLKEYSRGNGHNLSCFFKVLKFFEYENCSYTLTRLQF